MKPVFEEVVNRQLKGDTLVLSSLLNANFLHRGLWICWSGFNGGTHRRLGFMRDRNEMGVWEVCGYAPTAELIDRIEEP